MHGVVVLHPAIDESKGCGGIRDRIDPDVVAFEGFHEGLGHAVALGAFDWGEAWEQVERPGDLDGFVGGEDRAVVGKPLHRIRRADLDLLRKSGEFPVSNEELDDTATTVYEGI
jgi:hypothetical protein